MATKKTTSKKTSTKKVSAKKTTKSSKKTTTKTPKAHSKTQSKPHSKAHLKAHSITANTNSKKIRNEMLTIMFVDIVNYTKTTSQLSREVFNDMHNVFDTLIGETVDEYNGTIIKKIGDAFLITFKVATDAVHCGITMQKKFKDYNDTYDLPLPLEIRVAIHAGDVMIRNDDVYGDAVNVAARIEGIAKPRSVVFSEAVYSAMNKGEIEYAHIGTKKVKGVEHPIRVFRAKTEEDLEREERRRRRIRQIRQAKRVQQILGGAMIIILLTIIIFFFIMYFNQITSWF